MARRAATIPPAPALLSTTADWPHFCPKGRVTKRAAVSTGPPAGNGTMKFTARLGHASSARTVPVGKENAMMLAANAAIAFLLLRCLMPSSPLDGVKKNAAVVAAYE